MKLEIIALLICTIMGRTRRRRVHHNKGEDSKGVAFSSYDTDGEGNRVEKPAEVAAEPKRFMRRRVENDVVDSKDN